jgi:hypothetical protein
VIGLAAVAAADDQDSTAARLRGVARACGYPQTEIDKRIAERLERDYFAPARARTRPAALDPARARRREPFAF